MMETLFAPTRALMRLMLPLTLNPADNEIGAVTPMPTIDDLVPTYAGKRCLVVGGTRGIGRATAGVLRRAGAKLTVIGRSAEAPEGIAGDISTVAGALDIAERLIKAEHKYSFLCFTVGVWPSRADAYTADGIHKVLAIDLMSRHVILTRLATAGCLEDDVRVMSVLASSQYIPSTLIDEAKLKAQIAAASIPDGISGLASGFTLMLGTAIANDAWLQHMATQLPPRAILMGTFPGFLTSDVASSTFPPWLMPIIKCAYAPISDSDEQMGLAHASILATNAVAGKRRVSYWAAPLLQARQAHPLARDDEFCEWIYSHLEGLVEGRSAESRAG